MTKEKCQACEKGPVQWHLKSAYGYEPAYDVCSCCLMKLVDNSLSKKQFFGLLKNGHTAKEYLLHEDFYDAETGERNFLNSC